MRRIIQLTILAAVSLGAFEITALGGGNHQAILGDSTVLVDGISWHAGGLVSEGITFRRMNFTLGAETGVLYQHTQYRDMLYYYNATGEIYDSAYAYWIYDNIAVPLLVKGSFDFLSRINAGLGAGVSVVYPYSGRFRIKDRNYKYEYERENLDTYLALGAKAEVGVKIIPRLWIKAAVSGQFKVADLSPEAFSDKRAYLASLGLAWRF